MLRLMSLGVATVVMTFIRIESGYGQQAELNKPDYKVYDLVLSTHVSEDGKVDYKNLRKDKNFDACIQTMTLLHPGNSWTRNEQIAYWINLYNMYTLKLICTHPDVKSIKEIPNAWDEKSIKIGKQFYSLNQIENEILRKKFTDPRFHFVLCCSAVSCPRLYNHPYFPETLDKTMTKLTREFLNNPRYNQIKADSAQLSKIFEWYRDDFVKTTTFVEYLNRYSEVKLNPDATITYLEYDWALNSK